MIEKTSKHDEGGMLDRRFFIYFKWENVVMDCSCETL